MASILSSKSKIQGFLKKTKPHIQLRDGRWYAHSWRGEGSQHLLVPAISFCNKLNNSSK